jgi:hypothetical protein
MSAEVFTRMEALLKDYAQNEVELWQQSSSQTPRSPKTEHEEFEKIDVSHGDQFLEFIKEGNIPFEKLISWVDTLDPKLQETLEFLAGIYLLHKPEDPFKKTQFEKIKEHFLNQNHQNAA